MGTAEYPRVFEPLSDYDIGSPRSAITEDGDMRWRRSSMVRSQASGSDSDSDETVTNPCA